MFMIVCICVCDKKRKREKDEGREKQRQRDRERPREGTKEYQTYIRFCCKACPSSYSAVGTVANIVF